MYLNITRKKQKMIKIIKKTGLKPLIKKSVACSCGKIFNSYDRIIHKSFNTDLCESCYLKEIKDKQK